LIRGWSQLFKLSIAKAIAPGIFFRQAPEALAVL
jgi:hypothetical protein